MKGERDKPQKIKREVNRSIRAVEKSDLEREESGELMGEIWERLGILRLRERGEREENRVGRTRL